MLWSTFVITKWDGSCCNTAWNHLLSCVGRKALWLWFFFSMCPMLDCSLPVIMGKEQSEHSQTLLVVLCQIPAAPAWAAVIVNLLVPGEPCPFSTSLQFLQICWKSSWHKQSRLLSALAEVCVFGFSLFSVVVSSFPAGKIVIQQGNGNTGQEIRDRRCLTFP